MKMMRSTNFNRRVLISFFPLLLASCSVANYSKPISDLSAAIDSSVVTVQKIDREVTDVQNKRWLQQIEKEQAFIQEAENSCGAGLPSCSLVIRFLGAGTKEQAFPKQSMMPEAHVGLKGLQQYVSRLKAIVDADTAAKITTHANSAIASIIKIESEINKATGDSSGKNVVSTYKDPSLSLVSWLVTQYVEREKFNALAAATKKAQPVIEKLSKYHATIADAAASLKLAAASKAYFESQNQYDDADVKSKAVITNYIRAAATYNSVLGGVAAQPMQSFLEAHTKLNENLNSDGKVSLSDVVTAIDNFKDRAKEFKEIIDEFKDVAADKVGD